MIMLLASMATHFSCLTMSVVEELAAGKEHGYRINIMRI